MTPDKKLLSVEEIEAQTALELPDRQMLATITVVYSGRTFVQSSPKISAAQAQAYCDQLLAAAKLYNIDITSCTVS